MALAERQMSAMDLLLSVSTMEPRLPVLVSEPENLNPEAPQTNVQPFIKLENVNNANDNQYGESFRVGYSPHQLTTLETSYQANNSCPKSSDERMKALMEITGLDGKRIQVWFRNRRRKRKTPPRTLSNNLAETSNSPADSEGLIQPIAGDDEGEGEDEVLQMKRGRIKHAQDDDDDENDDVMDDDDSDEKEPGTKAGASISGNAPTHTRFKFQKYQLDVLERAYAEDGTTPRKSGEKLRALCDGTDYKRIQLWFKNRRRKERIPSLPIGASSQTLPVPTTPHVPLLECSRTAFVSTPATASLAHKCDMGVQALCQMDTKATQTECELVEH